MDDAMPTDEELVERTVRQVLEDMRRDYRGGTYDALVRRLTLEFRHSIADQWLPSEEDTLGYAHDIQAGFAGLAGQLRYTGIPMVCDHDAGHRWKIGPDAVVRKDPRISGSASDAVVCPGGCGWVSVQKYRQDIQPR
jgi:hypothetical protein